MIALRDGVPGGASRPGHRRRESGAVSVEAALAMLGLVAVTVGLAWCLGVLGGQLAVGEAARAAARVAARGESSAAVTAEARRVAPGSDVDLQVDADHVVVVVHRSVTLPGALARWGVVELHADATGLLEPSP